MKHRAASTLVVLTLALTSSTFAATRESLPERVIGRITRRIVRVVKKLAPVTKECTETPCIIPSIPKP